MFTKALHNHSQLPKQSSKQPSKPLFPATSRANVSASKILNNQSTGAKRKFDLADSSTGSGLTALHNTVYFDENDFDDDDILDLTSSTDGLKPAKSTGINFPPTPSKPVRIEHSESLPLPDPLPLDNETTAPPSSAPLSWSSSSPAHYLPPPKRRTLPWPQPDNTGTEGTARGTEVARNREPGNPRKRRSNQDAKPEPKKESQQPKPKAGEKSGSKPTETPPAKKPAYPWNTTMSALKAEQKELRKQQKLRLTGEKKPVFKPAEKVPSIFLSDEQRHVLDVIVGQGASVFFTGSAGTGKSVLMREIIRQLRDKYKKEPDRIAVTASTGLAACNIEGVTLHSFAGVGLGKEDATELVKKVKRNQKARTRWLRTKVLIIDEVSMVDGDFFDKLEELARKIRNNGRPFGGIQLVVTGDFFQLPPVPEGGREAKFSFAAATWNTSIQHTILLTHIFRQKDPKFAAMLNEMRLGRLTPESIDAFKKLARPLNFHDSLEATELFPTRTEVENANAVRMDHLSGEVMVFNAVDSGTIQDSQLRERLLSNCMAPRSISLKKGAQVMLIKNMDETLVNGSLGKVVAFMDESTFDYYNKHEEEFHGDSGDELAAARRKKIRDMSYNPKNTTGVSTARLWPVVSFVQPDGTERQLLCHPEAWKIELPNGEVQAQRQQVPLILAWALSIHKAQGQTLQRVKVDLGRVFERGQAYVALSRATSQSGLQVSRFDPRKVMVHPKVTEFYANLQSIKQVKEARKSQTAELHKPKPKDVADGGFEEFDDDLEILREMHG